MTNLPENSKDFVEGWMIAQTLGEGAYGEVKLLINRHSGEAVAMKMIDLQKHPTACTSVKKEVAIQRNLQHPNILRFFGKRSQFDTEFLFLEYAAGGELFDRIEPDVGMKMASAQRYFKQLISGVEYLHDRGIAHRDLKPENLLLDINDNVKISDFGMATMFRLKGRERQLTTKCGTLPYVAPEVLAQPGYDATPADLWSCGIILVALVTGELPWDQPSPECREFLAWQQNNYTLQTPWSKLETDIICLLRKILSVDPASRITLSKLLQDRWYLTDFTNCEKKEENCTNNSTKIKRVCSNSKEFLTDEIDAPTCFSQPIPNLRYSTLSTENVDHEIKVGFCFSQPTMLEDLIICSQMNSTQCANPLQRLVKRMTRFFVTCKKIEDAKVELTRVIDKLGYQWKIHDENCVAIHTTDRRKADLIYKTNFIDMDGKIMLDFRLSRGCGLDFKRGFLKIKQALSSIILKDEQLL